MSGDRKGGGKSPPITADAVAKWWKDALNDPRATLPDDQTLDEIASQIEGIRDLHKRPRQETLISDAGAKYGRLFLQRMNAAKAKIERERLQVNADLQASYLVIIAEMNAAERHIEAVLRSLDWPLPKSSWHDTARMIFAIAWSHWKPVGTFPRSRNPSDTAVIFVQSVLSEIGINKTPDSVSAALRERRGVATRRTKSVTRKVLMQ